MTVKILKIEFGTVNDNFLASGRIHQTIAFTRTGNQFSGWIIGILGDDVQIGFATKEIQ
ncbi:MAG: hypothetical protein AAF206_22920 [Bacteroidota bacterium]